MFAVTSMFNVAAPLLPIPALFVGDGYTLDPLKGYTWFGDLWYVGVV
jgi:hypothetical protein